MRTGLTQRRQYVVVAFVDVPSNTCYSDVPSNTCYSKNMPGPHDNVILQYHVFCSVVFYVFLHFSYVCE